MLQSSLHCVTILHSKKFELGTIGREVDVFNLLIEARFFPFNVHVLFRLDLYGKTIRGMT